MLNLALPQNLNITIDMPAHYPASDPNDPKSLLSADQLPREMCYPYLVKTFHADQPASHYVFSRRTWLLREAAQVAEAEKHVAETTLRYVKDNVAVDIDIEGMNTTQFLSQRCLKLSTSKGLFTLSKRLSRLMRPFRYFSFCPTETVGIVCVDEQNTDTAWDGMSWISADFVKRIAQSGQWLNQHAIDPVRQRRELLAASRLELTIMTALGQIKGHAMVVNGLPAGVDIVTNGQNIKREVSQHDGETFVGLDVVHGKDSAEIDKQSLINLTPFMNTDWLLNNLREETRDLLIDLDGYVPQMRDNALPSVSPLPQFLNAGGDPRHYAGLRRMQYRGRLEQLTYYSYPDLRLPSFLRRYICTDANINGTVPRGHYRLTRDSIIVNAQDWREYIADVLGGADMDDGVLVHRFEDVVDGTEKAVIWRQPNQWGEYIVLRPCKVSNTRLPSNDSRQLPPRIDTQPRPAERAATQTPSIPVRYTVAAMTETMHAAALNDGVLGQFCNLLMVAVAVYGTAPRTAPIRLERIIDATVKTGEDISWVREWITKAAVQMVKNRPIPNYLRGKVWGLLRDVPKRQCPYIRTSMGHWLDVLHTQIGLHIEDYACEMDKMLAQVAPPLELLCLNREDRHGHGERLNALFETTYQTAYGEEWDALTTTDFCEERRYQLAHEVAGQEAQKTLAAALMTALEPNRCVLYMLADAYLNGKSDRAVWNRTIAPIAIGELAQHGWLAVADGCKAISAEIQHVWYNLKYVNTPQNLRPKMSVKDRTAHALSEVARIAKHVSDITICDGRFVHSSRTNHLIGLLPKSAPLPNGVYIVQVAKATDDGGLRVWMRKCIAFRHA